jgi:16S rRNA A1518/A1519 N6-dimethyltransferase RsmA/KsgA/DIM1 with predicted DNA glycosylase/AP lyase activity
MARQRLGQHFLADPAVRERIRASLSLRPNDIWLEIRAGHGVMTQHLLREGRRTIGVRRGCDTSRRSKNAGWNGLLVSQKMAYLTLKLALNGLSAFHATANIPCCIASPILHRLLDFAPISAPSARSSSAKSPSALSLPKDPNLRPVAFPRFDAAGETHPACARLTTKKDSQGD